MAIGLGRMFGFHFLENFNYPYIATTSHYGILETVAYLVVGTWFRDYVYIPLGGNQAKA